MLYANILSTNTSSAQVQEENISKVLSDLGPLHAWLGLKSASLLVEFMQRPQEELLMNAYAIAPRPISVWTEQLSIDEEDYLVIVLEQILFHWLRTVDNMCRSTCFMTISPEICCAILGVSVTAVHITWNLEAGSLLWIVIMVSRVPVRPGPRKKIFQMRIGLDLHTATIVGLTATMASRPALLMISKVG